MVLVMLSRSGLAAWVKATGPLIEALGRATLEDECFPLPHGGEETAKPAVFVAAVAVADFVPAFG